MNPRFVLAWFLAPLIALAGCTGKKGATESSSASQERGSTNLASQDGSLPPQGEDLAKLVDLIVRGAADLPRAEFDPAALAAKLGKDPRVQFSWVRDNTYWAPYRGLLRGSKGVLLDRVGSNLDRAVLLGDLLRHSGFPVRLAHARLPDDRARELLSKVRAIPDQRRPQAGPTSPTNSQIEDEAGRQVLQKANALIGSQADMLQAVAREFAMHSKANTAAMISSLGDHWWVEYEDDDGKWTALDVLLPNSRIGETLIAASQRSEWSSNADSPSIPESDWHEVLVRVVVERYDSGNTTENTALETVIRPANVLDKPISLGHLPMTWPEDLPNATVDPNALGNAAANVKEWVPYLKIGQELVAQSAINEAGNLNSQALSPHKDINALGGGSLFGGFDAALSGGAAAESSQLTAEWIDYEIRVPGMASQKLRRPVFDVLGPANRSAKVADFDATTNERLIERYEALLSSTDILLQPCEFTPEFTSHLATASVVANQKELQRLSRETDPAKAKDLALEIIDRLDIWGPLPALARLRTMLGSQSGDWFVDQPNVLNFRISPPVVNADREPVREMIDFASNGIGIRPNSSRNSFDVRMYQGVVDTVAEAVALRSELRNAANAASIVELGGKDGNGSVLIEPRRTDRISELGWPEDVAARLASNVEDGFAAVVPRQSVALEQRERVGWWRFDPVSGETIGVLDTGFHGADEDAELRAQLEWLRDRLLNYNKRLSKDRVARLMRGETLGEFPLDRAISHLLNDLKLYLEFLS